MTHYVPVEKRSKAAQRQIHAARRGSWNGINPVTRIVQDGKKYSRSRARQDLRTESRYL